MRKVPCLLFGWVVLVSLSVSMSAAAQDISLSPDDRRRLSGSPITISSQQRAAVELAVKKKLKDPYSAKFGELAAVKNPDGVVSVCGLVNAKNSYGAYIGATPFEGMIAQDEFIPVSMGQSDKEARITVKLCALLGIDIAKLSPIAE